MAPMRDDERGELSAGLRMRALFHRKLGPKRLQVAEYRSDGEHAPAAFVAQQAILGVDIALDRYFVPLFRMADIVDGNVVVLAPEERHRLETLGQAEHVGGGNLALAFGDDPMLDADRVCGIRIGPARDIAG